MARTVSVNNGASLTVNIGAWDNRNEGFVYMSAFGYTEATKKTVREMNRKNNMYFCGRYFTTEPKAYEIISGKLGDSEYSHTVAYKKDRVYKDEHGREYLKGFIFLAPEVKIEKSLFTMREERLFPEVIRNAVYDKLYKLSPTPILEEWTDFIIMGLLNMGAIRECDIYTNTDTRSFKAYVLNLGVEDLTKLITDGLRNHEISIDGSNEASETIEAITGIDSYLNTFSEVLTERIQGSFQPRFVPGIDTYSQTLRDFADYASYRGGIDLYEAQKSVIQATSNSLDENRSSFIIGEMGCGKTAMGIATVLTHNRDENFMTNIVLCPGHIVEKWKHEVERLAPLSDAIIVDDFSALLALIPKIKNKKRRRHLWLIISKETAKFGYEERPAAVWNVVRKCYCCPDCGKPLYSEHWEGKGNRRRLVRNFFKEEAFSKKTAENQVCPNDIKVWNHEKGEYEEVKCGSKLWEPNIKETGSEEKNAASHWLKLGRSGWLEKRHMQPLFDKIIAKDAPTKEETNLMAALSDAFDSEPIQRAPRKYPIAKYIHRYLKNDIDYFIADEIHLLKGGDTAQGEAFGDLALAAKKTLGLTGTLLNGYASGIYYILYRTFAGLMKKEGYDYGNDDEFTKDYGVIKRTNWFEMDNGRQGDRCGTSRVKALPGVSPLVFTKFLLENAAFISQSDISSGLPGYQEIPVPIEMDRELKSAYKELEQDIQNSFGSGARGARGGMKTLAQMLQTLSVYPDQPYDQPPIIHPDTGDTVAEPGSLRKDAVRNKERAFVDLVKRKVNAGEKVLVYYHWTNRTDLSKKLPKLLQDEGLKAITMTSSVKARDREAWINQKIEEGIDVLICNPSLVETGLDLLDFTTIVYYQMGYNLFTMRQASRRSWRLSQEKDVEVYFLYYRETVQESALSLMATKLQASMAIEGKFSEEGLNAMSNNEDLLTQIASSVAEGIKQTVDVQVFEQTAINSTRVQKKEEKIPYEQRHMLSGYSLLGGKTRRKPKNYGELSLNAEGTEVFNNPWMLLNAV